jgi:hypothetical protein
MWKPGKGADVIIAVVEVTLLVTAQPHDSAPTPQTPQKGTATIRGKTEPAQKPFVMSAERESNE